MFKSIRPSSTAFCPWYFPVFGTVALVIYAMQKGEVSMPFWINNYVNDFLCMPIVLVICRSVVRRIKSDAHLSLPRAPVLALTLFYAFFFEGYLPEIHPRYTADVLDVLLYFLGSGFFLVEQYRRSNRMFASP